MRDVVEIQRANIAQRFDCVPSQLNYVIKTRFTNEHGYEIESKRGGGGYIRITKIENKDATGYINHLLSADWTFYFNNKLIILLMGFR